MPTITNETSEKLGLELIFKIHEDNLTEFQHLLDAGANPNYRDPRTGNTPLHYLFYYDCCNAQFV
jgi:hypothetical protein